MTTIDRRTRFAGPAEVMDPEQLFGDLADRLADTGVLAGRGVEHLDLPPLGLDVDGTVAHLIVRDGRLVLDDGDADDGPIVQLDAAACSELFQDVTSTFGLVMAGRVGTRPREQGPVRRLGTGLAGGDRRATGARARVDRAPCRNGAPLDLQRVVPHRRTEGRDRALPGGSGLPASRQGCSRKRRWPRCRRSSTSALAAATQGDGASWWARTDEGWYPSRILGFNLVSPTLQELVSSDRFRAIGELTDDVMVQRPPAEGDSAEGLLKKVGVVEGMSDVSWHKDCSMGGHSRGCCGLTVGISVTGADARSGELGVVAGSHRANVQAIDVRPDLDLPRVPLPTVTGDVTVHCSCTLHMSRPPVDRERRVVYTGFALAPRPGDVQEELSAEEIRRRRAALSDQVHNIEDDGIGRSPEAFALDG